MPNALTAGQEFNGTVRELTMTRMLAFSGGPFASHGWPAKNIHTDAAKAVEAGLAAPIASGIQCEADIVRLLLAIFGKRWLSSGKLHVKYPRPVFAGASLRPCARVRGVQAREGSTHVELDVWCETLDKQVVVVGTATCVEPQSAA